MSASWLARFRETVAQESREIGLFAVLAAALFLLLVSMASPPPPLNLLGVNMQFLLGMRFLNVAVFAGTVALTYEFAHDLFQDRRISLTAAALVVPTQLANHAIIAWTHVPTTFLVLLTYFSYHRFRTRQDYRWLGVVAAATGLVFGMRYSDIVILLPVGAHVLYDLYRGNLPGRPRSVLLPIVLGVITLVPVFAFHTAAFGSPLTTPYQVRPDALPPNDKTNLATEFNPVRTVLTVPAMLFWFNPELPMLNRDVQDFSWRYAKSALLQTSPFLVLAYFGLLRVWWRDDGFPGRTDLRLASVGIFLLIMLYGSWIFFSGGWTTNMRYLTPIVPFLAVYTSYGIEPYLPRRRELVRILLPAAGVAFLAGTGIALSARRPVLLLNIVATAAATATFVAYLYAEEAGTGGSRQVLLASFGAAVGIGAVMVAVMDNLVQFWGDVGTVLLLHADTSLFLAAVLAAATALFLVIAARLWRDRNV
ncbi:MAG: glycosyltransferase family 39 protein [Candidatus Nanohaloarchaea archaeon]|nr:glycosyltransferase family 39 protein [Candidatus Nanohaloarchaea archaeon]